MQTTAVLRTDLTAHLRSRGGSAAGRGGVRFLGCSRARSPNMVSISQRPDEVLDRQVPGHWKGDLLVGRCGRSHLVTRVERHSWCLVVLPLTDATTITVVAP